MPYSYLKIISKISPDIRGMLSPLPFLLKIIALCLIVWALARPQTIDEKQERNVKGLDIMFVMDISLSMLVEDMGARVTRLQAAKESMAEFIKNRISDRIGLILFSGESYTSVPLTLDYNVLLERLDQVQASNRIKPGTAIGVALANARARLQHSNEKNRVIIFLTDGESNAGAIDPLTALKVVKDADIKIYTIGVGRVSGRAPIVHHSTNSSGIKRPQIVYVNTRINKKLMQKMAEETQGKFFMATDKKYLENVFKEISSIEKQDIKVNKWTEYNENFSKPLEWAFGFYALAIFLNLTLLFRGF